jgi:YD repeat-containing protein
LTDAFGSVPGDPNWNPDADLDGDDEVSLLDFGILISQFGQVGAEEFAGTAQAASGAFTATVHVELGDWSAQTERVAYVVLQFKRAGTEEDSSTPIYEQVVSFAQNETVKEVQVRLPAGTYTLRALAYNDAQRSDISHWLRSELSSVVVPQGGGTALPDIPPPAWAEDVVPTDTVSSGGLGPSSADYVNLASGVFEHRPPADIVVYNPIGPSVSFSRTYRSKLAQEGGFSPGLSPGWVHNYDITISGTAGSWGALTLRYPNGATEQLTPVLDSNGNPTGQFLFNGAPYIANGQPSGTPGRWNWLQLQFKDESRWVLHPSSNSPNLYRLVRMENLLRQGVNIEYDTSNRVMQISNDAGQRLLTFSYSGGVTVSDYAGRTVRYTFTDGLLTAVSQVSSTNPLWVYAYQWVSGVPYLVSVGCADPTDGVGTRSHPVYYDGQGKVVLLEDANGNVRSYRYEGGITTVTVYNTDGSVAHTWSQKVGNLNVDAGMRDAAGHESSVVYNGYRPVQVTNRNGQSTTLEYDQFFNLTRLTPPRVPAVQYEYDTSQFALGRLVRVWQGSKTPTEFVYYPTGSSHQGLLHRVRVPKPGTSGSGEQVEIEYVYTSLGNLLEVRAPSPNPAQGVRTTRYFYETDPFDAYSEPERLNCPLAVAVYDGVFNPSDVNDRLLYRVSFRYDTSGRVTQVIDGLGSTTRITYNAAGQVETVTYPEDSSFVRRQEKYIYSAVGGQLLKKQVWNLSSSWLEQEINLQTGKEGELIGQSGGVQTAGYVRDALYRIRGVVDGRGNRVQFGYDPRGFLQSKLYPLGDTYTFFTDNEGNLTQRTDPDGVVVEYVRDPVDSRIEQVNYPGMNMDVLVSYDSYNRVVGLSNGVATISYTYDDGDRLLSETVEYADMPGVSFTVAYQYHPDGSLQSITAPYRVEQRGSQYVAVSGSYQYDYQSYPYGLPGFGFGPGEVVTATTPWACSIHTYFDRRGLPRRQDVIDGNSQLTTTMRHNARGLLSSLTNTYNYTITLSNFINIRYDAAGNRVEIGSLRIEPIVDPNDPARRARGMLGKMTYAMDETRRRLLTEETFEQSGYDIPTYSLPFAYDPSDNLTSTRGFSFGYNANNQITNSGFGYDVNGNATLFNNVGHVYDYENRVLQAGFIQADYRPDGKRAWKQPGDRSTRTYYVYDGGRVILEFNPANGFYQAYAYGANGLACSERQDGHLVYAFDPAGNLVHRLRNGTVLSNSWFDSYGGLLYDDSATDVKPYPSPDSVGYQGQWGAYTDVESRAYAQYLRWVFVDGDYYHPLTGTFLTRRSAGTNEYSAGVNPVDSWADVVQDILDLVGVVDPTGVVDVVNAVGYALRGKWGSAAVTALGIIPYVGDVAKAGHTAATLTRGARQASRELKPVVIGENMKKRVEPYARMIGAETIDD